MAISNAALTTLAELLDRDGAVLDRVYADRRGGINYRRNIAQSQMRLHIGNDGQVYDRNDPDSYLRHYGIVAA